MSVRETAAAIVTERERRLYGFCPLCGRPCRGSACSSHMDLVRAERDLYRLNSKEGSMHRLILEIGWPILSGCVIVLALAVYTLAPLVVRWVRHERELARRAAAYTARVDAGRRTSKVMW